MDAAGERYVGTQLAGGWILQRLVGAGKFAWVFDARGPGAARAAVKLLYRDDTQAVRRFHREVKVLAELPRNANCVRYLGHGRVPDGKPWLAMEFVDGFNLSTVMRSGRRIPERAACSLMAQICDGFRELHKLGLTHRDITPDNIMITHQGRQVKIMDFGLVQDSQGLLRLFEEADILQGEDFLDNLDAGLIAGTPEYMAPEQITDPRHGGERLQTDTTADVFALGVVFYQLVTGEQLFPYNAGRGDATGRQGLINYLLWREHIRDRPLACPDAVNAELWSVLNKALNGSPKRRQGNASELGDDIRFYLETGQGVLDDDMSETISQAIDPERLRSLVMTSNEFEQIRAIAREAETILEVAPDMTASTTLTAAPIAFPPGRRPPPEGRRRPSHPSVRQAGQPSDKGGHVIVAVTLVAVIAAAAVILILVLGNR